MFRIEMGKTGSRYCDGVSRRSFLQVGVAGMASMSLAGVLRAREASAAQPGAGVGRGVAAKKDTSVLLIWLDGGPGHMDMYDMKPDAPPEYRGLWSPIKTNVPGIEVTELFQQQAKVADKFSIIRSLHHDNGDHFAAAHAMLTSRFGASGASTPGHYPSIGSIATAVLGSRVEGLPPYVAVPYGMSVGLRPGYFGANYIGSKHNPFETEGDPNQQNFKVNNLALPGGMDIKRLENRKQLHGQFDRLRREVDSSGVMDAMDRAGQQAYDMVTSEAARKAFDISAEPDDVRQRYGRDHWGQCILLGRRLAEAGVTFTTVHLGGWDHHWDLKKGMENYLPKLDVALAALFQDLADRDLMERVLVVVCGEFSRTPRMNDGGNGGAPMSQGTPGRDHWGNSMFAVVAGGGLKMGQVVGSTDRLGETPLTRPLTPGDLHATIYQVLGVDPSVSFLNHAGRPVPAIDSGEAIAELM
jgi:hypothetical protein